MNILAIIDVQNDFITGPLGSLRAEHYVVPNIVKKLESTTYDMIVFTYDTHDADYLNSMEGQFLPVPHCIFNTEGFEIPLEIMDAACKSAPHVEFLYKNSFGTFEWADLDLDCDTIEVVGLVTDICVISNALILRSMFPQSKIIVDLSCCAATTIENRVAAARVMRACNIEVKAGGVE